MSDPETTTEDSRVATARDLLAEYDGLDIRTTDPFFWLGTMAQSVRILLAYVDERAARDAALEAAARRSHDDLMRTVAGIEAERGES